jgi:hypothetical protein
MQTNSDQQDLKLRTYFLQQGQSINKLNDALDNSLLAGHLKRGVSILFEFLLFVAFLFFLFVAIYIPTDPLQFTQALNDTTSISGSVHNDEVTAVMMIIKGVVFIASFMPILLMLLLRRNRKKGAMLHTVSVEVDEMKKRFDKAVKEFNL